MGKRREPQAERPPIREYVVSADGTEREITGTKWTVPAGHLVYEVLENIEYEQAVREAQRGAARQAA